VTWGGEGRGVRTGEKGERKGMERKDEKEIWGR